MLMPEELCELGLEQEQPLCEAAGMHFHSLPIEDRSVPSSMPAAVEFLKEIEGLLKHGKSVVVHCRQGIGRSGLVAAALLVLTAQEVDRAVDLVTTARGVPVPETPEQRKWIDDFSRVALGRA